MKFIEGFTKAKEALSRKIPAEGYPVSAGLRQRLNKTFGTEDPEVAVRQIIGEVRRRGDAALFDLTSRIDGIKLASLEVGRQQIEAAYRVVDGELVAALKFAAGRINAFHSTQKESIWHETATDGLCQLIRPLNRVGVYVPGGTASYPSTVLMTAIPARVAGVAEVVMVTPPSSGGVPPATLVAADIAGVSRIFSVGGAQAIAALAYGTESVPGVDKVCGPGNIFVVLAKKLVYGVVDIDGLQGPSEVLIIADETASPAYCAADLLAQAEHDPLASAILVTTSRSFADEVSRQVAQQLESITRRQVASEALENGLIAIVGSLDEAVELANDYAPEHLCLMLDDADSYIERITNAGCIVAGRKATVALGDYVAGPSHALPTGGTARFSSPLSVADFIKYINVIKEDGALLQQLGPAAAVIARAEGLDAHARAVEKRLQKD
ncbi:MAG: histidinol dehydrogenase [Chloroflexota bacterium]